MLEKLTWGTYVFFGILTFIGAGFIWIFFPETKGLSLEEMDVIFGSAGMAAADEDRMREIHREIGLDTAVHGVAGSLSHEKDHSLNSEVIVEKV